MHEQIHLCMNIRHADIWVARIGFGELAKWQSGDWVVPVMNKTNKNSQLVKQNWRVTKQKEAEMCKERFGLLLAPKVLYAAYSHFYMLVTNCPELSRKSVDPIQWDRKINISGRNCKKEVKMLGLRVLFLEALWFVRNQILKMELL